MVEVNFFPKNRKGWIRIVEVFIAILLIVGAFVLIVDRDTLERGDIYSEVHEMQISILRSIELNNSLRSDLLSATLPVNWSAFDDEGLGEVREKIESRTAANFECLARLCNLNGDCVIDSSAENLYVESLFLAADLNTYSPRKLNLFCWER